MFNNVSFQTLGIRGSEKKNLETLIEQNGGLVKRFVKGNPKQVVIYSPNNYCSGYTLSRAYNNNIPVVDSDFIKKCAPGFVYQQAVDYSNRMKKQYKKRKPRDNDDIEIIYHTPTKGNQVMPRKVKKYVDYSEYSPSELDEEHMKAAEITFGDNLSDLQKRAQETNSKFKRWDLDEIQQKFFSQFLVELDETVFEFEQTPDNLKQMATLEEILEKEKNQQTEGSFLKAFTKSYDDSNKLSPFSIFFKLQDHIHDHYWESIIHSILSNLFLHPVSYEKNIIFGTTFNQNYLSEALTKRANWLQEHSKLENKQDLFQDFFLTHNNIFEDNVPDTFLICEAQRYDFENEDVFLHKDICNLVLNMRCMFKNWVDRLLSKSSLTGENMQKIRVFGALIAGTTIAWLEMKLKFHKEFEPAVKDQSLPPFTYHIRISDIHNLTTVKGLANSLMILQHTLDMVNNLKFEKGKPIIDDPSTALFNTDGKIADTSLIYKTLISSASIQNVGELMSLLFSPSGEYDDSSSIDFIKQFKLKIISTHTPVEASNLLIRGDALGLAILATDQSFNIFLSGTKGYSPIIVLCKQHSNIQYIKVEPTNNEGWKIALFEKLKTPVSSTKDDNSDNDNDNSDNDGPYFDLNSYNPHLEDIELLSQVKKKFNHMNKDNSLIPSLYSLLDLAERHTTKWIQCKPYASASLVIVFLEKLQFPKGKFVKLTHQYSIEEHQTMKYLQELNQSVKNECNHIAQVYKYEQVFLKDNNELFFASYLMNKQYFGKETCFQLNLEDFDSEYVQDFFRIKNPIDLTYMELLEPINIKELLKKLPKSSETSFRLKVLVSIRWIGHCLTILQQLHSKLNLLHCDISFDNILTRRCEGGDKMAQIIQEECRLNGIRAEQLISDLVVSDLNTSIMLNPIQNNPNDELRGSIEIPNANKFPYTLYSYEFYGTMQSDNYAMAIFIAKLVRRFVFEDFNDFTKISTVVPNSFEVYGKSVTKYFKERLSDENVDPTQKVFLCGLIELLDYIIHQKKEKPSLLSNCRKIYQSKIACLFDNTI